MITSEFPGPVLGKNTIQYVKLISWRIELNDCVHTIPTGIWKDSNPTHWSKRRQTSAVRNHTNCWHLCRAIAKYYSEPPGPFVTGEEDGLHLNVIGYIHTYIYIYMRVSHAPGFMPENVWRRHMVVNVSRVWGWVSIQPHTIRCICMGMYTFCLWVHAGMSKSA